MSHGLTGAIDLLMRYSRNRGAVSVAVFVVILILASVLSPWLSTHNPREVTRDTFLPPSGEHFFGTDDLGRDLYSMVVHGARTTLIVGILSALFSTVIGTIVGALSGYFLGVVDDVLMRLTELFLVTPRFFLVLVVVAIMGPSVWNIILIISLFSWPPAARLVRAEFLGQREREYVEAARAIGQSNFWIMMRHILPNSLPPIIVRASLGVGQAILLEAGVSFLGLGDPEAMSWGRMLNNAQQFLGRSVLMAFWPGAAIFLTVLAANLMGDGINDALNPRWQKMK